MSTPYGNRRTRGAQVQQSQGSSTDPNQMFNIQQERTQSMQFTDATYGPDFHIKTQQPSDATVLANFLGTATTAATGMMNAWTQHQTKAELRELDAVEAELLKAKNNGASDQEVYDMWKGYDLKPGKYTAKKFHSAHATVKNQSDTEYATEWLSDFESELAIMKQNGASTSELLAFTETKASEMPEIAAPQFERTLNGLRSNVGDKLIEERDAMIRKDAQDQLDLFSVDPTFNQPNDAGMMYVPDDVTGLSDIRQYLIGFMGLDALENGDEWSDEYELQRKLIDRKATELYKDRTQRRGAADRLGIEVRHKELGSSDLWTDDDISAVARDRAQLTESGNRAGAFAESLISGLNGMLTGSDTADVSMKRFESLLELDDDTRGSLGLTDDSMYADWKREQMTKARQAVRTSEKKRIAEEGAEAIEWGIGSTRFVDKQLRTINESLVGGPVDAEFVQHRGHVALVMGGDVISVPEGSDMDDQDLYRSVLTEAYGEDRADIIMAQLEQTLEVRRGIATKEMQGQGERIAIDEAQYKIDSGKYVDQTTSSKAFEGSAGYSLITGGSAHLPGGRAEGDTQWMKEQFGAAGGTWNDDFMHVLQNPNMYDDPDGKLKANAEQQLYFIMTQMGEKVGSEPNAETPKQITNMIKNFLAQGNNDAMIIGAAQMFYRLGDKADGVLKQLGHRERYILETVGDGATRDTSGAIVISDSLTQALDDFDAITESVAKTTAEEAAKYAKEALSVDIDPSGPSKEIWEALADTLGDEVLDTYGDAAQIQLLYKAFGNDDAAITRVFRNAMIYKSQSGVDITSAMRYTLTQMGTAGWKFHKVSKDEYRFVQDRWGHGSKTQGSKNLTETTRQWLDTTPISTGGDALRTPFDVDAMTPDHRERYEELKDLDVMEMDKDQLPQWKVLRETYTQPAGTAPEQSLAGGAFAVQVGFDQDDPITKKALAGELTYGEILRERFIKDLIDKAPDDMNAETIRKNVPPFSEWKVQMDAPVSEEWDERMADPNGGWSYKFNIPGHGLRGIQHNNRLVTVFSNNEKKVFKSKQVIKPMAAPTVPETTPFDDSWRFAN